MDKNKNIFLYTREYQNLLDFWLDEMKTFKGDKLYYTDIHDSKDGYTTGYICNDISNEITSSLNIIGKQNEFALNIILISTLIYLKNKLYGSNDIILSIPVYKKDNTITSNSILPLRIYIDNDFTFKELLLKVKSHLLTFIKNQDLPYEKLMEKLPEIKEHIFDIGYSMYPVYKETNMPVHKFNLYFEFSYDAGLLKYMLYYNKSIFDEKTVANILERYTRILNFVSTNKDSRLSSFQLFSDVEAEDLIDSLSGKIDKERFRSILEQIDEQVTRYPHKLAIQKNDQNITYQELKHRIDNVSHELAKRGVKKGSAVVIITNRSGESIIHILGTLYLGAIYVPVDVDTPYNRVVTVMDDCDPDAVIISQKDLLKIDYCTLKRIYNKKFQIIKTTGRLPNPNLDQLAFPDRTLINYDKYNTKIGQAMARGCFAIQATRGCPYKCTYCHNIWSKKHYFRSAENIYEEVLSYYKLGVKRFAFVDDIFNLNVKNSRRFFQLVLQNKIKANFFFPNGVRGDILKEDYIDLMIEAGTVDINMSLETASPRIQKLIEKNLDLDKLHKNLSYLCSKHPQVIKELGIMIGFPTETEKEAESTIEFVKSIKWLHFPYLHLLHIYPNTSIERWALESGISQEAIYRSMNMGFHEIPPTMPFPNDFIIQLQSDFYNTYFLSKERLLNVIPNQFGVLSETDLLQKYNTYLPKQSKNLEELFQTLSIPVDSFESIEKVSDSEMIPQNLNEKIRNEYAMSDKKTGSSVKILLIDLSLFYSKVSRLKMSQVNAKYEVFEPPLGLMYLSSNLKKEYGAIVDVNILKSQIDFDSNAELIDILNDYNPDIVGLRTLTYYKDFYHQIAELIKNWRKSVPIICGGPYATTNFDELLQDPNVDLIALGEGEETLNEIIKQYLDNKKRWLTEEEIAKISGLAYRKKVPHQLLKNIQIIVSDDIDFSIHSKNRTEYKGTPEDCLYAMYTSGTSGIPKGVLINHSSVFNLINAQTKEFKISRDENILQLAPLCFDASVEQLFLALTNGASVTLIEQETIIDEVKFINYIKNKQVTHIHSIPDFFLNINFKGIKGIKRIIAGGDKCYKELVERIDSADFINEYGPTETTVTSIEFLADGTVDNNIPIGKPISNTSVFILNEKLEMVPQGLPGELYIGGKGVGVGYLNNVELTHERFIQNPYQTSEILYKTGDIVRTNGDGNILFICRNDSQVKIRGYRIELFEIEQCILSYNGISSALVTVNDARICAYFMSGDEVNIDDLKSFLGVRLPDYMMPNFFVRIQDLPRTINGKIDRTRLPEPKLPVLNSIKAASDNVEETILGVWSDVLGLEKTEIGVDRNFFEIGGHSLKANSVISMLNQVFNIEIPLTELFKSYTIESLAKVIRCTTFDKILKIKRSEQKEYYPLSSAQRRMFFLQKLIPESTHYNTPQIVELDTGLTDLQISEALQTLIERHESFRTSFKIISNEPVQIIVKSCNYKLEHITIDEEEIHDTFNKFPKPFNLEKAPLIRVCKVDTTKGRKFIYFDIHHIITDARSNEVIKRDFIEILKNKKIYSYPDIDYKDFALWQQMTTRKEKTREQELFWKEQLKEGIESLNLPFDYPRPANQVYIGKSKSFKIEDDIYRQLIEFSEENALTRFTIILSVLNIFLQKICYQDKITVGTITEGRTNNDMKDIVGLFVNTLVLINTVEDNLDYNTFVQKLKDSTILFFENQDFPFDSLVKLDKVQRDLSRNPIFDVLLNMLDYTEDKKVKMTDMAQFDTTRDNISIRCDLTLTSVELNDGLFFNFDYNDKLFKDETIDIFIEYFNNIFQIILSDPIREIKDIQLVSEDELSMLFNIK